MPGVLFLILSGAQEVGVGGFVGLHTVGEDGG